MVVLYSKSGGVVAKVVVIPEKPKSIIVLVNNASRNREVLKFVLVIWAIKKYQSILGCHLTQPKIDKKLVLVIKEVMRLVLVNT